LAVGDSTPPKYDLRRWKNWFAMMKFRRIATGDAATVARFGGVAARRAAFDVSPRCCVCLSCVHASDMQLCAVRYGRVPKCPITFFAV